MSSSNNSWPQYQYGFGNEFSSEALPGALPQSNNPFRCPYLLHAEQISGSPFTAPRHKNKRTWMYRIRPSVVQDNIVPATEISPLVTEPDHVTPERLRWNPFPIPSPQQSPHSFVEGLVTIATAGDPGEKKGTCEAFLSTNF